MKHHVHAPKTVAFAIASLGVLSALGVARANVVASGSSAISVTDIVTPAVTGGPSDLVASVSLSGFNFAYSAGTGDTTLSMTVSIDNQTNAALFPTGALTAFGFNVNPNAIGASDTSSQFTAYLNDNFPTFGTVNVCEGTGNNCAGGANNKLNPGSTASFTLNLLLAGDVTSADLGYSGANNPETYYFKWQTGLGSFESDCTVGGSCGTTQVPEPASLALFGVGLAGLGLALARKRKAT